MGAIRNASVVAVVELLFNGLKPIPFKILTTEEPHRLSSASAACTAQHSPSHIQPECGETAGFRSRVAESLLGNGRCGCAAVYLNLLAYMVVDKGVDVLLLMCLENGERV